MREGGRERERINYKLKIPYRREIDGLRALAVLPVILFHAGFEMFSGGFVGVDVFFVISGYLITTIIINELAQGKFSIVNFYERRARRIFPALFVVMFASLIFGFFWLLPDEFKNLGQSLVATSLFANNILLGLTSGYWDLASDFKPLLHTWSLGVEEQYYIIIPILLMVSANFRSTGINIFFCCIFFLSFLFANWLVYISPSWAFYILPTRIWEIGMGTLAAFYLQRYPYAAQNNPLSNILSFSGLLLILFSILTFDKDIISPGWPLLAPTVGAVLIIIFCASNSFVFQILSSKIFVFLGLLSYSLYLWSQPTFSYLRAYSIDRPNSFEFIYLLPFIFLLSFLTWKYVESPFRNKLIIKKNFILIFTLSLTFFFITVGLYLNKSYGMPYRFFSKDISKDDVDKRIYNEKVFLYKKDYFSYKSLTKILIIGASKARDFTNITLENFDISQVEIVYRNDLEQCIESQFFDSKYTLYDQADVIVFADGYYKSNCYLSDIAYAESRNKKIFYIGNLNFGYNLNWLAQIDKSNRGNQYNIVPISILQNERDMVTAIPSKNFNSLLAPVLFENKIPITDELGRLLSADRVHLTKYGAIFFGQKVIVNSSYANLFK